jgi:hypothetical protein
VANDNSQRRLAESMGSGSVDLRSHPAIRLSGTKVDGVFSKIRNGQFQISSPKIMNMYAGDYHFLEVSGRIKIFDSEAWPYDNEEYEGEMGTHEQIIGYNEAYENPTIVGTSKFDLIRFGGEIRIEIDIRYNWLENYGWIFPVFNLYEGTSEGTNDLDGSIELQSGFPVHLGGTAISVYLRNTNEGGDWAILDLTFRYTTRPYYRTIVA